MDRYPLEYGWDEASNSPDTETQIAQAPQGGLDNELKADEVTEDGKPIGELPNPTRRQIQPLYINWRLAKPSLNGGYVVQKVNYTAPSGSAYTHWEAWRVEPGQDRPAWKVPTQPQDTFAKMPSVIPGVRKLQTEARFYEALQLPTGPGGFEVGKVLQAGAGLPSTEVDPNLPTVDATAPFNREWESDPD